MKTVAYIGISLDGFIARSNGDIDWLVGFESPDIINSYKEFISAIDAIVIGRGTFEKVLTYTSWPYEQHVLVLSTTLKSVPEALKGNVTILSMGPRELVGYLADGHHSRAYVDGGRVIQNFLNEDCLDELVITRVPILLGSGIPLFGHLTRDLHFRHIHTSTFPNGLVRSHYERDRT